MAEIRITNTYVANVRFFLSNLLKVPLPHLGSNGFTDRAQNTQMLHLVVDEVVTRALQQTQSSWGNVELGHLVLLDDIPVAREVGVGRGTFEDDSGASQKQRRVHNVGVTSNPADITTTEEAVIIVDIKHIFAAHGSTKQVTGGGMHNALGFASGA